LEAFNAKRQSSYLGLLTTSPRLLLKYSL